MRRKPIFRSRVLQFAPRAALLGSAAIAVLALGCAPSGYYRSTSSSLDSLLTTNAQLQKRLGTLEREIASTKENVQATRASSDTRLSELNQRMDMLQGKLEESGVRFTQLAQKVEGVKQRMTEGAQSGGARDTTAAIMDPDEAFKAAYSDYTAGRYSLAKTALTEYLRRYPDTEVSDNAQFLIGESAYNTGDFNGAIEAYRKVVENYPKGDKVAAALLKAGIASARIKDTAASKKYYALVIQKYPKSDEARIARERLAQKTP
jgi:tol-pal system protein YbgF